MSEGRRRAAFFVYAVNIITARRLLWLAAAYTVGITVPAGPVRLLTPEAIEAAGFRVDEAAPRRSCPKEILKDGWSYRHRRGPAP
jgi:hypothetical protein